jgi:hypothetical protein
MKRPQSSVADELNIRAMAALDAAREMPPGDARAEAMNKAMILRNAVEVHEHFCARAALRPNEVRSAITPSPIHRLRIMTGPGIQKKSTLHGIIWAPRCLS